MSGPEQRGPETQQPRSAASRDLDWDSLRQIVRDLVARRRSVRSFMDTTDFPFWLPTEDPWSVGADPPPANDPVLRAFLESQRQAGLRLAAESDILELDPLDNPAGPPHRYLARFHCTSALRQPDGRIVSAKAVFTVRIAFPPDYLRRVHPLRVVALTDPLNVVHPNLAPPLACIGHIPPGFSLVDLLYQVYEILTYEKWAAHDFLSAEAAAWARQNHQLFPLDRRPLKRRPAIVPTAASGGAP